MWLSSDMEIAYTIIILYNFVLRHTYPTHIMIFIDLAQTNCTGEYMYIVL